MQGFLIRLLITAAAMWLAAKIVPGMNFAAPTTLLGAAILLGLINALIRPLAIILTLPLTVLTLGLFLVVINAAMLSLVAWLLDGFSLSSFGTAVISSILISFFSWLGSAFIGPSGRYELMMVRKD